MSLYCIGHLDRSESLQQIPLESSGVSTVKAQRSEGGGTPMDPLLWLSCAETTGKGTNGQGILPCPINVLAAAAMATPTNDNDVSDTGLHAHSCMAQGDA